MAEQRVGTIPARDVRALPRVVVSGLSYDLGEEDVEGEEQEVDFEVGGVDEDAVDDCGHDADAEEGIHCFDAMGEAEDYYYSWRNYIARVSIHSLL